MHPSTPADPYKFGKQIELQCNWIVSTFDVFVCASGRKLGAVRVCLTVWPATCTYACIHLKLPTNQPNTPLNFHAYVCVLCALMSCQFCVCNCDSRARTNPHEPSNMHVHYTHTIDFERHLTPSSSIGEWPIRHSKKHTQHTHPVPFWATYPKRIP